MPLSVCKKINVQMKALDVKIEQLERTFSKVVGELNDVSIKFSEDDRFHQIIDIVILDIPKLYGLILSRNWLHHLKGFMDTNLTQLWLPSKGEPNKIKINRDPYTKHIITDINDTNEPVKASDFLDFDSFFSNFVVDFSAVSNLEQQS